MHCKQGTDMTITSTVAKTSSRTRNTAKTSQNTSTDTSNWQTIQQQAGTQGLQLPNTHNFRFSPLEVA